MAPLSAAGQMSGTLDVNAVAELLGCSSRHVRRLADSYRMPRPVHLGRLVRWRKTDVEQWLDARCPSCRPLKATGGAR